MLAIPETTAARAPATDETRKSQPTVLPGRRETIKAPRVANVGVMRVASNQYG